MKNFNFLVQKMFKNDLKIIIKRDLIYECTPKNFFQQKNFFSSNFILWFIFCTSSPQIHSIPTKKLFFFFVEVKRFSIPDRLNKSPSITNYSTLDPKKQARPSLNAHNITSHHYCVYHCSISPFTNHLMDEKWQKAETWIFPSWQNFYF